MTWNKIIRWDTKEIVSNRPNKIVVHNLGENPIHSLDSIGANYLRYLHTKVNKWNDIGYHWVVSQDFGIESGRDWWKRASATKGHNSTSLNICICEFAPFGYDPEGWIMYCPRVMELLKLQVQTLMQRFDIPKENIFGHRDLQPLKKDSLGGTFKNNCPGFDVQLWVKKCL